VAEVKKKFVLHAPNVHCGGGLTLLKALIDVLPEQTCLIIDERLPIADAELKKFQCYRIQPTLWHRLGAERLLKNLVCKADNVLCFGNLPPLFHLDAKVTLFIQNRYLVEPSSMRTAPLKLRLKLTLEQLWLKYFQHHANKVLVQTASMKRLACHVISAPITVAPFATIVNLFHPIDIICDTDKKYDFIYVASGEVHKNHYLLLQAWVVLAKQGHFPSLCLTVKKSSFPELCIVIEDLVKDFQVNVENVEVLSNNEVQGFYKNSKAFVFPSVLESFGLPLLEAQQAGLPILASEMDYVRDLVDPVESFDPNSAVSIARAVSRFMGYKNEKTNVLDAQGFLHKVLENDGEGDKVV